MAEALLEWALENREFALLLIPVFGFLETCVGIGLFISSFYLVIICSVFYGNNLAAMPVMAVLAAVGSSLGDHAGFYFGRMIGDDIHHLKVVQRNRKKWEHSEALVRRYGIFAMFIGRFIPAIRTLVPAVMGISGFARLRYSLFDISACFIWSLGLSAIVLSANQIFMQ